MAIERAGVVNLPDDITVVGERLSGADSALEQQVLLEAGVHREIEALPPLDLVAVIRGSRSDLIELTDLVQPKIEQTADLLATAAREP